MRRSIRSAMTGAAIVAAATVGMGVTSASASSAPTDRDARSTAAAATQQSAASTGCVRLGGQGYGWADIHNDCSHGVRATVSVDWAWDPGCVPIERWGVARIHWDGAEGPADYAYEC